MSANNQYKITYIVNGEKHITSIRALDIECAITRITATHGIPAKDIQSVAIERTKS